MRNINKRRGLMLFNCYDPSRSFFSSLFKKITLTRSGSGWIMTEGLDG